MSEAMTGKWDDLKAWLEAEREAASQASGEAVAAVTAAAAANASAQDFSAAVRAADEANARCAALRKVAEKIADLERGESRPRLRDVKPGPGGG